MSFNPASFSTIKSIGQRLLKSIESENATSLPVGLFDDDSRLSLESIIDLDLDELRACISKTVDILKQQLFEGFALICRRRTSFLPIHRLPPEILSASIAHSMADIECHNHQKRLIQLSTVSRWWREVALGTPSLWGVISSQDPGWIVSLALKRSKDAPLTILYESTSYSSNLYGGESNRESMGSDDFLGLVSPHTARWADATLPLLGSSGDSVEWLNNHPIQLSRHLQRLNLGWDGSPSTDNAITRFFGHTECLLDFKPRNLHVVPADIIRILASTRQVISLDLDSLVASVQQEEPSDGGNNTPPPTIDLPRLKTLSLKGLPPSLMDPIVRNLDPSTMEMATIVHDIAAEGDPPTGPHPFATFTARLVATRSWIEVLMKSEGIDLRPCSRTNRNFSIDLLGGRSTILKWLRLRCLPQITREYSLELEIDSEILGEDPDPVVLDNLMRFTQVGSVLLRGRREAWRWMWLLSLPDAVKTDSVNSKRNVPIKSWLWPHLTYVYFNGDHVDEFTTLAVLLARYGARSATGDSTTAEKDGVPCRLERLRVRPGDNIWRAEVFDRIKELVGPGCFRWIKPK
ncbi:hypothetical protein FRC04_003233 [Tulasnella sp. 424]|nr:hypothetical protein FRC04_003233 [Tulasnella sp. 424]KAG8966151.1 hypothetical protein FRC05_002775 [Tulasnella sp. 425]